MEEPILLAQWACTSRLTKFSQWLKAPVSPYITLSPVGSDGKYSLCDTDQPVADGPVGPSVTLGPVGPGGTLSQCKPDQLVADGPVGSTEELGLVDTRGKLLRIDIKTLVMTDEPANSIGTSPSSDSGIIVWESNGRTQA